MAIDTTAIVVVATTRQYTRIGTDTKVCTNTISACDTLNSTPSVVNCTVSNNKQRTWEVGPCISTTVIDPSAYTLQCTSIQNDLCSLTWNDAAGNPVTKQGCPSWAQNTYDTEPIVSCTFKYSDFLTCKGTAQTCEEENSIISVAAINAYTRKYGAGGDFSEQNMDSLYNNLLPAACFTPTTEDCKTDSYVIKDGEEINYHIGPMQKCSMLNTTTELGSLCYDWYKSNYSPAMERLVGDYCETNGVTFNASGEVIMPTPYFETGSWSKVSQDCLCVLRSNDKTYQEARSALGIVYADACWYKPCVPDTVQLKPDITMFDPSCPSYICSNIVNIVDKSNENEDTVINYNVQASINCGPAPTLASTSTFDADKFKSSIRIVFIFIIIMFIVLCIVILLMSSGSTAS